MRAQFASGRNQICPITTTLTTGSITSGKARTYYFWLQARNCIGYTLLSTTSTITATVGSGIRLTFPSDCFRDGENWERYAVSFSTTNDPSNASLLLEIPAIDINQNPISLPLSINLTLDSHLVFETSTATLPNNVPHGFIVNYTSKGKLYRYDSTSSLIANGEDIIAATVGNWISFSETNTFDIYVNDTTSSVLGCDVAIEDLNNNYLISQYYAGDGSDSFFRRIWLYNDTTVNVNESERIGLTVDLQGVDVSASFTDLLTLVFEGYVDKATGEIDIYEDDTVTLLPYVNVTQDYTAAKSSTLTIPKPLLPNVSYQLKVYANFSNSDLARNGLIPAYNSDLSIIPFLYSNNGISIGVGAFTGDVILGGDDPNLRRVYPDEGVSVFVDSGSGIVKQFLFENVGESIVSGLAPNTEDQILVIDGNGSVFLSTNLTANLAQRALVGTLSGESTFTSLSSPLPGDLSSEITATITFPTTIRNNYPDVIAGSSKGTFFAEQVRFYVKRTNLADSSVEYRHFTRTITPSLTSDTFILTYNAGTVATSIPSNTAFGLYTPSSIVVDNVTNIFPAENYTYEVCYCFVYTGTSITSINHSPSDGCIKEISLTLTDVIETSARYRGDWNSVTPYASGDIVYTPSTQSWWVANASSTNVSPSSLTPQWRLFSDLNYKIKTSSDDPTPGYLENKIVAGTGISVSTVAEQVQISLSTSTGYNRIQDEGSNVTQRERLNFIGSSVSVTDDPSNTRTNVTINAIPSTEKGAINGVATLDSNGLLPSSQLPISAMEFKSTWDASTNTPTLVDGVGNTGDVYRVNVAGTRNLGSGSIDWAVGDWVLYNGSIWQKGDNTDSVASVFGRSGVVTPQNGDYTAAQVTVTPYGNIASNTVQAAIQELDDEKQADIQWQDEGVNQGTAGQVATVNVTGAGATLSVSSGTATLNIPGAGTSPTLTLIEQGSAPTPGVNEATVYVDASQILRYREESSGTINQIAVLGRTQTYTAAQGTAQITLTDGATISVNAALSNSFTVTLGGNRTLANPTNTVAGFTYVFRIVQDATGSRTLSYGTNYKFPGGTTPTLSTAANAVDVLTCYCGISGGNLNCTLTKDFK